jgi:DASH complex subunit SPC19
MNSTSSTALQGCVTSLRTSMQLLESSINTLDTGVHDYPRLTKVLQTTRVSKSKKKTLLPIQTKYIIAATPPSNPRRTTQHFELVSEPSLQHAQQTLLSSLEPELNALLARVETHLDKMSRREQSLIAKADLQEGRLSNPTAQLQQHAGGSSSRSRSRQSSTAGRQSVAGGVPSSGGLSNLEALKMSQLRQKKERLSYAVSRLELQAGQRERQLRKSMAFQ